MQTGGMRYTQAHIEIISQMNGTVAEIQTVRCTKYMRTIGLWQCYFDCDSFEISPNGSYSVFTQTETNMNIPALQLACKCEHNLVVYAQTIRAHIMHLDVQTRTENDVAVVGWVGWLAHMR